MPLDAIVVPLSLSRGLLKVVGLTWMTLLLVVLPILVLLACASSVALINIDIITWLVYKEGNVSKWYEEGVMDGSNSYVTLLEGVSHPVAEYLAGEVFKGLDKKLILRVCQGKEANA